MEPRLDSGWLDPELPGADGLASEAIAAFGVEMLCCDVRGLAAGLMAAAAAIAELRLPPRGAPIPSPPLPMTGPTYLIPKGGFSDSD